VQGPAGHDGKNGAPGRDGVDGRNGADGRDGKDAGPEVMAAFEDLKLQVQAIREANAHASGYIEYLREKVSRARNS
jgi:hypothetical protein